MTSCLRPHVRPSNTESDEAASRGEPVDGGEQDGDQADDRDEPDGEVIVDAEDQPDGEEEADVPRCLPCPGAPSASDRLAHELTHWPFRRWCEHCVRGRAVGPNAKKVPASSRESSVPRAHMDYANLQEEVVEIEDEFTTEGSAKVSMTILVMMET